MTNHEDEYRAFASAIQSSQIELTDELRKDTKALLDSVKGADPEVIQRSKELVDRMCNEQSSP